MADTTLSVSGMPGFPGWCEPDRDDFPIPKNRFFGCPAVFQCPRRGGGDYSRNDAVIGQWFEQGAGRLNLPESSPNQPLLFSAMATIHAREIDWELRRNSVRKEGGKWLANRRIFQDWMMSPPKGVSLVALLDGPPGRSRPTIMRFGQRCRNWKPSQKPGSGVMGTLAVCARLATWSPLVFTTKPAGNSTRNSTLIASSSMRPLTRRNSSSWLVNRDDYFRRECRRRGTILASIPQRLGRGSGRAHHSEFQEDSARDFRSRLSCRSLPRRPRRRLRRRHLAQRR